MSASDRVGAPRLKGDAIEAIRRRALHMQDVNLLDETCESILDAVEPIIRADERGWIARANADSIEAEVRERIAQEPCSHDLSMHDAKIRADEQAKLEAEISERIYGARGIHARNYIAERDLKRALAELAEVRERLRAQVEALPMHEFQEVSTHSGDRELVVREGLCRADVLALLGGESDG